MLKPSQKREAQKRAKTMEGIVSAHETELLRYAARLVNSPTLAQDVVQNVFIKLFKNWDGESKPSNKLKSWLFRVTHNESVDFIRRESRLNLLHTKHAEEKAATCSEPRHKPPSHEEKKATVLKHLNTLHPREQQVVLLRLEQGLSYHDISEITGHKESYIGNILHHAIRKLSLTLQQEGVIS